MGFDGYAVYGKADGKPAVLRSSSKIEGNDNLGTVVFYKNGEIIKRMSYQEFVKQKK
ncbi:hypothetical protein [Pedobacter sp. ASV12]|uniref:hypothetical protein n=1 Tax=Pedobacter sp. ASV12 TaxID=2795120 RepID=UPI0018EC17FF|nr:hypothetical protein [Pedobacter sp. ASV12]